jgi:hypothetical protein
MLRHPDRVMNRVLPPVIVSGTRKPQQQALCPEAVRVLDAQSYTNNLIVPVTAVRLKVEKNQLVGVLGEIGVQVDVLKGA